MSADDFCDFYLLQMLIPKAIHVFLTPMRACQWSAVSALLMALANYSECLVQNIAGGSVTDCVL